jgi:hypothetical protein
MKRCRRSGRAARKDKKRKKGIRIPRATVSLVPQTFDFKTCPGGWVKLRRMSYGELMNSQDLAYQVQMKQNEDTNDPEASLTLSRMVVEEFQIRTCVLDHNLEDDRGRKLNFASPQDVHSLDANIGQELSGMVADIHDWKKQLPNSEQPSANGSSTDVPVALPMDEVPEASGQTGSQPSSSTWQT